MTPTLSAVRRAPAAASRWPELLIFVVGLAARLVPEIVHGAMTGNYGYDVSVYYAAADSLLHGRMPYRDYVLLHPPGIVLADTPFALLGSSTTDQIGFAAATICFALLGAVNAVLVIRVAQRLGLPRRAPLVAGTVYALWFGALIAEFDARLEPLGCFLLLCGLLALLTARDRARDASTRGALIFALLAGVAFGATISVKIWWTVPVVVLLCWELFVGRAARRVVVMVVSIVGAVVVIDGPFLLAARSKMWTMVVLDQLGRPVSNPNTLKPFAFLITGSASAHRDETWLTVAVGCGAALLLVLAIRAWRIPAVRVIVVMLLAQLVQLAVQPSWFTFYADFVTVGLSLVVGAACVPRTRTVPRDAPLWLPVSIGAALAAVLTSTLPVHQLVTSFPSTRLTAAAAGYRCVMSDSPMELIDMNALSRDLRHGCPNLVDVTGLHYDLWRRYHHPDAAAVNVIWNRDMVSYLRSGDAVIFMRTPASIGLTAATSAAVEQNGLVVGVQHYDLYRVQPGDDRPGHRHT